MFSFEQIKQVHLEITNNCQASCPMCSRNINGGLDNPLIKIQNWTVDDFKKIMSPELLSQLEHYYYCGTFGDPILNNELIDMCRYTTDIAPNVSVAIHTNGGARSQAWWKDLASVLPKKHRVVFGIDGLSDTHHLYRVGTVFETVIRNATAFIEAGGIAEWVFIKFKHNEHQVEQARQLSKDLGFQYFTVKNSSRFIIEPKRAVMDRTGNVTHYIEPSTETPLKFIDRNALNNYKEIVNESAISCKVQTDKEIYIDAYKDFYPCCWTAAVPYSSTSQDETLSIRLEMQKQHTAMISQLGEINLLKRSLEDIIDSEAFQTMWNNYWHNEKLIVCARTCGQNSYGKFKDQFEEL